MAKAEELFGDDILFVADNSKKQVSATYTINSADTWERKTFTFAGDTSGVINNDTGDGFEMLFYLAAGSNRTSGTARSTFTAMKIIPNGYLATHTIVYDNNPAASTYTTYSSSVTHSAAGSAAGICGSSTATNTEKDIPDIVGGDGAHCILNWVVGGAGNRCYGGRITLAKI